MNPGWMAGVVACVFGMAWGAQPEVGGKREEKARVVVVELFTSEGCSSCPPAEELLNALAKEEDARGKKQEGEAGKKSADEVHVVVLAFHVDYWDRLGWPDRFASAEGTARQREYAAALKKNGGDSGSVYTPQMVVNGVKGFVGSNGRTARAEIAAAGKKQEASRVGVTIAVRDERKEGEPIRMTVSLKDAPKGCVVLGALVEDGLTTEVKRGENAGKTLVHERVVRAFSVKSPDEKGAAEFELAVPKDGEVKRMRVVALVQEVAGGKVVGAGEARVE